MWNSEEPHQSHLSHTSTADLIKRSFWAFPSAPPPTHSLGGKKEKEKKLPKSWLGESHTFILIYFFSHIASSITFFFFFPSPFLSTTAFRNFVACASEFVCIHVCACFLCGQMHFVSSCGVFPHWLNTHICAHAFRDKGGGNTVNPISYLIPHWSAALLVASVNRSQSEKETEMKKDTEEWGKACQGAFQHDARVNGVRVPRTEEEHWILCVWCPAGEPWKSSIHWPVSVQPRSDRELFPGPQRADGNSQRGKQWRSPRWFWDVLKLARLNGGDRRPAHQPLGERDVSGPLRDSQALIWCMSPEKKPRTGLRREIYCFAGSNSTEPRLWLITLRGM